MPNNSITSVTTKKHLETIRQASNYPTFRAFVSFMTLLMFALAVLLVVVAVIYGEMRSIAGALIGALCLAVIGKVIAEVSLMIADIADSTIYTSTTQLLLNSQSNADERHPSQVIEQENGALKSQPISSMFNCTKCGVTNEKKNSECWACGEKNQTLHK